MNSYQLAGPNWLADSRLDVVAKVAPGTTEEQVLEMWRSLFAERFKLVAHHEARELPIYALLVGRVGPKFRDVSPDPPSGEDNLTKGVPGDMGGGPSRIGPEEMQMTGLADMLARNLGHPVIDQTGLKGRYLIRLQWQRDDLPSTAAEPSDLAALPNLFSAVQEQLGLKLEAKKGTVDVLVIDHIVPIPVEN